MKSELVAAPASVTGVGSASLFLPLMWKPSSQRVRRSPAVFRVVAAFDDRHQNHYAVLGVPRSATSVEVKKSYRLLARKWHPDVSKDARAAEVFKSIRLAYEVLSNETKRTQYDRALTRFHEDAERMRKNSYYSSQFENGVRSTMWAEVRQRMQKEGYWKPYDDDDRENTSFYDKKTTSNVRDEKPVEDNRGSFVSILISAFFSLFLMRTVGSRLSLTFSSLMALADFELDGGYKLGYIVAWFLGDVGGILLTICLSFTTWACGKTSSGTVTLVILAMWVGSYLATYLPLPQGALLVLLYMSAKLQDSF